MKKLPSYIIIEIDSGMGPDSERRKKKILDIIGDLFVEGDGLTVIEESADEFKFDYDPIPAGDYMILNVSDINVGD